MKKQTIILFVLLLLSANISIAQNKKEPTKPGIKPALLVVDIQKNYLSMVPERDKEVSLYIINVLIDMFHKYNCLVIRIYNTNDDLGPKPGTAEFEFPETVRVNADDPKIIKTYGNAFTKTDLDKVLKEKGCNTVFVCGLSAVGCVLATWVGAQDLDYYAFLVKDAIMSHDSEYTNQAELMFEAVGFEVIRMALENSGK